MQFSKLTALLALPLLAVASPAPWGSTSPTTTTKEVTTTVTITATATATELSQCNTGSIQCCNSTEPASSSAGTSLLALLGIVLEDIDVLLGLNCNPISVLGLAGDSCTAAPVCCENNSFKGIVAIGCVPIIINL